MSNQVFCEICGKGKCPRHPYFDIPRFVPESLEAFIVALAEFWRLPKETAEMALEIYGRAKRSREQISPVDKAIASVYAAAVSTTCLPLSFRRLHDLPECICYVLPEVKRAYRSILERGLVVRRACTLSPVAHALEVARKLKLPSSVKRKAIQIAEDVAVKRLHLGKDPAVIGAAICYVACLSSRYNITQNKVADAAGISASTLGATSCVLREAAVGRR